MEKAHSPDSHRPNHSPPRGVPLPNPARSILALRKSAGRQALLSPGRRSTTGHPPIVATIVVSGTGCRGAAAARLGPGLGNTACVHSGGHSAAILHRAARACARSVPRPASTHAQHVRRGHAAAVVVVGPVLTSGYSGMVALRCLLVALGSGGASALFSPQPCTLEHSEARLYLCTRARRVQRDRRWGGGVWGVRLADSCSPCRMVAGGCYVDPNPARLLKHGIPGCAGASPAPAAKLPPGEGPCDGAKMTPEYCAQACYAGMKATLEATGGIILVGPENGEECFCDIVPEWTGCASLALAPSPVMFS